MKFVRNCELTQLKYVVEWIIWNSQINRDIKNNWASLGCIFDTFIIIPIVRELLFQVKNLFLLCYLWTK